MAPYAPNNTNRMFIEYTSVGQSHTLEVRFTTAGGTAAALATYDVVTTAFAPWMAETDAFTGAKWSVKDSDLSFPLAVEPVPGTNEGAVDPANMPNFTSLTGRSALGTDVKYTFFSPFFNEPARYRVGPAVYSCWPPVKDWLGTEANGVVAVDGVATILNGWINVGVNAYYQRKARKAAGLVA